MALLFLSSGPCCWLKGWGGASLHGCLRQGLCCRISCTPSLRFIPELCTSPHLPMGSHQDLGFGFSSPVSRVVYNGKRNSSPRSPSNSSEIFTPAHEENVRFIYEAWQCVERDLRNQMSGSERGLVEEYVEKIPNPSLKGEFACGVFGPSRGTSANLCSSTWSRALAAEREEPPQDTSDLS
uniref:MAPK regulated corepressor interacting protein 1 n=1 Tax=Chrysemys picta bellii TaxID=8478 RepID=A0A8C3FZY5_CHRPI